MKNSKEQLIHISNELRYQLVELSHDCKTAHLGSALSCVDILVVLYKELLNVDPENPLSPERDRFILSKGHAANALYAILAKCDFFSEELLETIGISRSKLEEHPGAFSVPGVEIASGSLGHGLPIGLGMAAAAKLNKQNYQVFVLMSDGECNEGSVWEAAMFAAGHAISNITVLIDFNKWQATDRSCEVMALEPLAEKWHSFGWNAIEVDGHDHEAVFQAASSGLDHNKPTAIICHTVKGKGISFMEDDNNWHYRIPTKEEVFLAKKELTIKRY